MSYQTYKASETSIVNSDNQTTGDNWNGTTWYGNNSAGEVNDYAYVGCNLQTDVGGTLYFDFSQDGTNWSTYPVAGFDVAANINEVHTAWKGGRYIRPRFVGGGAPSSFRLKTFYSNHPLPLTAPLNQGIGSDQDATVVRAVATGQQPDDTFTNIKADGSAFSTTTNLTAGQVYDSGVLDARGYTQVQTHINASDDGTLQFIFCNDAAGTDVVRTLTLPFVAANGYQLYSAPTFSPYIQYKFTNNGAGTQTDFYYETKFYTKSVSGQLLRLDAPIAGGMIANVGRNIIVGRKPGDNNLYENVAIDSESKLDVAVPRTAFGELAVAEPTPVIQASFPYSTINGRIWNQTLSGSADISAANSVVSVSAGAANSFAELETIRRARYRPGQGIETRFTSIFTAPTAGSTQEIGIGDNLDGFFFCTSGTEYGINRRQNGTDNITLQSNWNLDVADGTQVLPVIDFTKANVHQIQYQWLGYGAITYSVEDPRTGQFTPVHREQYANANTTPSVFNPTLPLRIKATNTTNTAPIVLKSSSLAAFVEGKIEITGPQFSVSNTVAANDDIAVMGIGLQNKTTYSGATNRVPVIPDTFTVVNLNDDPAVVELYKDVNTSGETFTDVNSADSVVEYMSAGTATWPASALFRTVVCPPTDSITVSLNEKTILFPGENIVASFTVPGPGTDNANVTCAWNWQEDI